jgi:hypothetical protein
MLKRHEIEVLLKAGHAKIEVASAITETPRKPLN